MRGALVAATLCLGLGLGLGLNGCGHEPKLLPAPGNAHAGGRDAQPQRRPEVASAAVTEVNGVLFAVEGDAWPDSGVPLGQGVMPVLVLIENRGDLPVVVHHDEFALAGDDGERFIPLAPDTVPVSASTPPKEIPELVFSPGPVVSRDKLRPQPLAPGPNPTASPPGGWETSFPYNRFYIRAVTAVPPAHPPEPLARALPEGTLARGQRAAGFIYFSGTPHAHADDDDGRRLVFEARLVRQAARGGRSVDVAQAKIPMRVQ